MECNEEVELREKASAKEEEELERDDVKEVVHEVKDSENLVSLAARYDTTPSVLAQYNRLSTRLIFAGQKLKIPPKTPPKGDFVVHTTFFIAFNLHSMSVPMSVSVSTYV